MDLRAPLRPPYRVARRLVRRFKKTILPHVRKMFVYTDYDSDAYWRSRADSSTGQSRVLWTNEEYNSLVRARQYEFIERFAGELPPDSVVLDIGCGIGIVAKWLVDTHPSLVIDAVDFPEMVAVAKCENSSERIHYIVSNAADYIVPDRRYQLVLSSGCFSAIRRIDRLERAITNAAQMTAEDGTVLMIDPFHRWSYLARAKYGSRDVVRLMRRLGFRRVFKSGILFWPYRMRLTTKSDLDSAET